MILEKRDLLLKDSDNIFKLIADELSKNENTQIIICNHILRELRTKSHYNVSFLNSIIVSIAREYYTLHGSDDFSSEISKLEVQPFGSNYSQVIRFYFKGYSFANNIFDRRDYDFWQYEIERILVIESL